MSEIVDTYCMTLRRLWDRQ